MDSTPVNYPALVAPVASTTRSLALPDRVSTGDDSADRGGQLRSSVSASVGRTFFPAISVSPIPLGSGQG